MLRHYSHALAFHTITLPVTSNVTRRHSSLSLHFLSRWSFRRTHSCVLLGGIFVGLGTYILFSDHWKYSQDCQSKTLSSSNFISAKLISSINAGPNSRLMTLAIPLEALSVPGRPPFYPIWSVFIKDDDIQVERPYTPLEGVDAEGHMTFWIKKYDDGEVGRWLHSRRIGDVIDFRGPMQTWSWKDDTWDEVVMISGGTGITPFYQLMYNIMSQTRSDGAGSKTRFTLLHSSPTLAELPPPRILHQLVEYADDFREIFQFNLFVDSLEGSALDTCTYDLNIRRIGRTDIERTLRSKDDRAWWRRLWSCAPLQKSVERKILFLVCGPEPMITALAGPYGRNFAQGPIGGVLGEMGFSSHQVWKL